MRLLAEYGKMRRKQIIDKTSGKRNIDAHLRRLLSFGYISREKRAGETLDYHLTDAGRECLETDNFPQIRQIVPFAEVVTKFMLDDSYEPLTSKDLHSALQDTRSLHDFRSLLGHLIQRQYIEVDETSTLQRYYLSERGREYAEDPEKFREEKRKRIFQ
ncbi:hypothetical protein [uncultured Methanolobus sp.]|uniref:hypothetical protein n=1 Tax=uncultured Methanolobus sp. TaxID=218300 RepID=UPI002AAAECDE|nr:hypothetical protein [uncultured Methanolobus sp.]